MVVIKILCAANGMSTKVDGTYVKAFDADAYHGRGHLVTTDDPLKAKTFSDLAEAHGFWTQRSRAFPTRGDGKPNQPLTAYNVEMVKA